MADLFDEFGVSAPAQDGDLFDKFGVAEPHAQGGLTARALSGDPEAVASMEQRGRDFDTKMRGTTVAETGAAGAASGTLGLAESLYRTPNAVARWAGGLADAGESGREVEPLSPETAQRALSGDQESIAALERRGRELNPLAASRRTNPMRAIESTADFLASGQIPGTAIRKGGMTDIAERISRGQQVLSEEFAPFKENAQAAQRADAALKQALAGDFAGVGEIVSDPKAMAGLIGQAAPSLVASYVSGGSIPFMAWMEAMEVSSNAAEFEQRTGQKISNADFMQAQAQAGVVNSILEKVVPDALLKGEAGRSIWSIAETGIKEMFTEGTQALNTNVAEKITFNPKKDVTEGVLPGALGGLGAGAGSGAAQYAANHNRPTDTPDPIQNAINESQNILDSAAPVTLDELQDQVSVAPQETQDETAPVDAPQFTTSPGAAPAPVIPNRMPEDAAPGMIRKAEPGAIDYTPERPRYGLEAAGTSLGAAPEAGGIPFDPGLAPAPDLRVEGPTQAERRVERDAAIRATKERLGDITLPEGLDDARMKRLPYRQGLESLSGELTKGGGVTYVRDENGTVTGRTPSVNPEWFQALAAAPETAMSVEDVQAAVKKALAGEKLGVRQARAVGAMLDTITGEREQGVDHSRAQLEAARKAARDGFGYTVPNAGEVFAEQEYAPDWNAEQRILRELTDEAMQVDADRVEAAIERLSIQGASSWDIMQALDAIITGEANEAGQAEQSGAEQGSAGRAGEGQGRQEGRAPAGAQAGQVTTIPPAPAQPGAPGAPADVQTAADISIETSPNGGVLVKGDPAVIRTQLQAAGVTGTGIYSKSRGGLVFGKSVAEQVRGVIGRANADRRTNDKARQMYEAMSKEELIKHLLHHELTGIKNKRAFVHELEDAAHVISVDADSLKWVNDNMSPDSGDKLLQEVSDALVYKFGYDRSYHTSGDEFYVLMQPGDDLESMKIAMAEVEQRVKATTITVDRMDGSRVEVTGITATPGYGATKEEADYELKQEKQRRESAGQRAGRGERPSGARILPAAAAGQPSSGRDAASPQQLGPDLRRNDGGPDEVAGTDTQQTPADAGASVSGAFTPTHELPDGTPVRGTDEPNVWEDAKGNEWEDSNATPIDATVDDAAHQAATSPQNDQPEPTEAQRQAGNYTKGHVRLHGLDISIENPSGSKRRPEWPALKHHYGYIRGTEGKDGDHVDVFLGPQAEDADAAVVVIDQLTAGGKFDEHKIMLGFASTEDALRAYFENYEPGWDRVRSYKALTVDQLKAWVDGGNHKQPVGVILGKSKREALAKEYGREATTVRDVRSRTDAGRLELEAPDNAKPEAANAAPESRAPDVAAASATEGKGAAAVDETQAVAILDRANVTGKERLDIMRDFREGKHTLTDLEAAYPAKAGDQQAETAPESITRQETKPSQNAASSEVAAENGRGDQEATAKDTDLGDGKTGVTLFSRRRWYKSALAEAIDAMPTKVDGTSAKNIKLWLFSNAAKLGVKKDELQWSGVMEWLDLQGKRKVAKTEIAEYLEHGGVQVDETMLGDRSREYDEKLAEINGAMPPGSERARAIIDLRREMGVASDGSTIGGETKFSQYTTPGGRNYRELLLTLPKRQFDPKISFDEWFVSAYNKPVSEASDRLIYTARENYKNNLGGDIDKANFTSPHYGQPNILAHVRFNERTDADGKKVLFIEEIQSDWGQKGKKEGFRISKEDRAEADALMAKADKAGGISNLTEAEQARGRELGAALVRGSVPSAPFVTDTKAWVSLALKRMIAYAADNGFDRVAWTTGEQQADRYDLSKQVDAISYVKNDDGTYDLEVVRDGRYLDAGKGLPESRLADTVGKEVSDKIVRGEGEPQRGEAAAGEMVLRGDNLKVGGEGMRAFYDQIVPQVAGDVLKKVGGGKVGDIDINLTDMPWSEYEKYAVDHPYRTKNAPRVRGFDITPAMREAAASGLSLFSKSQSASAASSESATAVQSLMDAITDRLPGSPKVHVIASMSDAPADVRAYDEQQRSEGATGAVEGFYHNKTGQVFLVLDGIGIRRGETAQQAVIRVWAHEVLGHAGLRGAFGKDLLPILREVALRSRAEVKAKAAQYGLDFAQESQRMVAAEEVLVELAETQPESTIVKRAIEAIRRMLRNLYLRLPKAVREQLGGRQFVEWINGMSDAEMIERFILPARGFIETGSKASRAPSALDGGAGVTAFSRSQPEAAPEETAFQKQQRIHQDKFNRFRVIEDWLREQGIDLPEAGSVYRAEERYHGRVATRTEDFRDNTLKPLIKKMQQAGFTLDQVAEFLHAQHAEERNRQIASVNPAMPDGGSGMTNAEARAILAQAGPELVTVANEYRAITDATRDMLLRAGILSQDMADAWQATYQHYVPLKGGDEVVAGGAGQGFTAKNQAKRALGHGERAELILENIQRDHERAIMLVEKNRVGQHLLKLALEAGHPDLITIDKPKKRAVLKDHKSYAAAYHGSIVASFNSLDAARAFVGMESMRAGRDAKDFEISVSNDPAVAYMASPMLQPNETQVYVDGHVVRVQFNDELLARAYMNLGTEHMNAILSAGRSMNAFLSRMYTGYSVDFIFTNAVRDWTTGLINLTGEEGIAFAAKAAGNYAKAAALLSKYAATGEAPAIVKQYRADGGTTGAAYLSDLERLGHEAKAAYEQAAGLVENVKAGKPVKGLYLAGEKAVKGIFKPVERLNMVFENAMRLSAYMTALESGMSREKAASLAKNATVNFNRKGELGQSINALYLFHNASVQGSAIILRSLFKGKHKHQAQALVAGLATIGYLMASTMGGGDDDEYEKLPEHVKERNLTFKTKDGWVTIPIPYGYGWFFTLGRKLAEVQQGKIDPTKAALQVASNLLTETTVLGEFYDSNDPDARDALFLAPTVMQIVGTPITNRSSLHRPVIPETYNDQTPDSQRMWRNTVGTFWGEMAGGMNKATGGDEVYRGWADVSPETLKYIWATATGGTGRGITDAVNVAKLKAEGADPELRETPVVRRFVRNDTVEDARARFWQYAGEAKDAKKRLDLARKTKSYQMVSDVVEQERYLLELAEAADYYSKMAGAKRDEVARIKADESLSVMQKRLKIRALEREEEKVYDEYVGLHQGAKDRASR